MIDISPLKPGTISVFGVPFESNSSFLKGTAEAPEAIREALHSKSANMAAENEVDLGATDFWVDVGNLGDGRIEPTFEEIEETLRTVGAARLKPLVLGGDHSITYPIMKGLAHVRSGITILQFDAHPDLYDILDGNRFSHGCPFARIMEEHLVKRLVQVGIRTMTPHQKRQVERFGVEVIRANDFSIDQRLQIDGPLYISLDMDVFDPAFAPGVSHHEPGGLSTRDVLHVLQNLNCDIMGADIVELNPTRDPLGITAMLAAKLLKELLVAMHPPARDA